MIFRALFIAYHIIDGQILMTRELLFVDNCAFSGYNESIIVGTPARSVKNFEPFWSL